MTRMQYPKRPDEHVIETASWRVLRAVAPPEWIVRELSERDYGIDAYIEFVSTESNVTGRIISVQLKGTTSISWKRSAEGSRIARSPQVKSRTVNYWFALPVPVFLLVADTTEEDVFFVAVKDFVRTHFDSVRTQTTVSFPLSKAMNMKSTSGLAAFDELFERERTSSYSSFQLMNLVGQIKTFSEFIRTNRNRDIFLPVDAERHLQFRVIHETCRTASRYLGQVWDVPTLEDLYSADQEEWRDHDVQLHEKTLASALQVIQAHFPTLVRKTIDLVTVQQASYWRIANRPFFDLCSDDHLEWTLKDFEHDSNR